MPQYETNTMRICTMDADGVQYDASAPVKPRWSNAGGTEQFSVREHCAELSSDVPWQVSFFSILHGLLV